MHRLCPQILSALQWEEALNGVENFGLIAVFFDTLFGNLCHFGQNVLHLVPKQKREKKRRNMSEMRYLNRLRFKQGSLVIEQKETGKSLYDFAMDVLILMLILMLGLHVYVYSKQAEYVALTAH